MYDPRIAEVKAISNDILQVTFTATFKGYVELYYIQPENPNDHDRLLSVEERLIELAQKLDLYTTKRQWEQMTTYQQNQLDSVSTRLDDLQIQIGSLSQEISEL